jgi:hypothetical protein
VARNWWHGDPMLAKTKSQIHSAINRLFYTSVSPLATYYICSFKINKTFTPSNFYL